MKLYLITRKDLPPGAQAAQLVHGMAEFADKHPVVFKEWKEKSNTVVCLAVKDEAELRSLHGWVDVAHENLVPYAFSTFEEPDFGNAMTVLVIEPRGTEFVKGLRLALSA